jgi:membrane protease YdiL (CAAX protease family)
VIPSIPAPPSLADLAPASAEGVVIPQYSRSRILAVWAAAALPMAALAWLVAPALAERLGGPADVRMAKALIVCLGAGLVWQFALVAILVGREQGTLRWSTVRRALWLQSPRSPRTGRTGGRTWSIVVPFVVALAAAGLLIPTPSHPADRDLGVFLEGDAGQTFLAGNWGWFAIIAVQLVFNTVLGEELLFRGLLLPRMNGAFGRADWVANGVLFAVYHLHVPWVIPAVLLDMFTLAYPTKRFRSAWIGIAVHSAQTVFIGALVLAAVV